MALGTISSIGLGSSLDLQKMLDDLRGIDESPIKKNEENRTLIRTQANTLDSLNAKLMGIRSSARTLSLASSFLGRKVTSGKEDVVTATAASGIASGNHTLDVQSLARKSAWQSAGFDSPSSMVYGHPETGLLSGESKAVDTATSFSFTFGPSDTAIEVDIQAGATLDEVAEAINGAAGNADEAGAPLVKASVVKGPNGAYIRMAAADPDDKTNQQILMEGEGLNFIKPDLSFSYQLGVENQPVYVSVAAGSTYENLVNTINEKGENYGMQAAIINDGSGANGYRFTLTSRDTGEANRIFLDGLAMEEVQGKDGESLNARFTVNGIAYQRNNDKDINDVIPGLTLNLQSEGKATLTVKADYEGVKTAITEMMEGLMAFSGELVKHRIREPENDDEGLLNNVASVRTVQSELNNLLSQPMSGSRSGISSLFDLGLSIDSTGQISFDESKLDAALENDPDSVRKFFIGDADLGVKGFGDMFNDRLTEMTSDTGAFSLEKNTMEERAKRLDTTIENAKTRLDRKYEIMTLQFIRLDKSISALNNQADFMKNMFDSFNNAANSNKK
jgi:flagellar hook-associated protein 2